MNCQIKHKMKWLISDVCIVCESDIIHCKLEYSFQPNSLIGFCSYYKHPCHEQILRCLSHGFTLDFLFSPAWLHGRGHEAAFSWHGSSSNASNQEGLTKKEGDDVCAAIMWLATSLAPLCKCAKFRSWELHSHIYLALQRQGLGC